MSRFDISVDLGERSYPIVVEAGVLKSIEKQLAPMVKGRKCLIVTDSNVSDRYEKEIFAVLENSGASVAVSKFEAGEAQKHLETMIGIYHDAVTAGLDRSSFIIALGGGVPGDIAGFTAATYMRGIKFIQIPSSLLAMVDSSVGGKTGVDLPQGKNLVGAFWQPEMVVVDPELLKTLPRRELLCGLAEVVKYAVIMDAEFFDLLEANVDRLLALDLDFYSKIISHCCQCKADIVKQDEREGGIRAILNYGHTFGHAVEAVAGFGIVEHGEGVAIGMAMAADTAVAMNMIDQSLADRQELLLKAIGLPVEVANVTPEQLLVAMGSDKKKEGSKKKFILPEKMGKASVFDNVEDSLLLKVMAKRCH